MPSRTFDLSDARCRGCGCGYALRDLPAPRCPECGRAFDPADSTTVYLGRWQYVRTSLWPRLRAAIVPPPMTLPRVAADVALACLLATIYGRFDEGLLQTAGGVMNVLLLVWLALLLVGAARGAVAWPRRGRRTAAASRQNRRWWTASVILAACSLPPVMQGRACPHATYYDFGYVGLAHGTRAGGGPCNNLYWRGPRLIGNWWLVYRH